MPREDQGLGNKETPRQINDLIIKETFAADHHRGCSLGKRRWVSPWIIEDAKVESYGQPADNRGGRTNHDL